VKPRLPHPLLLLLGAVAVAAAATWVLPAGEYERRDDVVTGRRVVVPGTYHPVERAPVGPFAAAVAVPRGIVDAADVVAVVLLVGGAWVVVDRLGTLGRLVGALVARFQGRGLVAVPVVSFFFAAMGALENMQEEIIPLIPALMLLGRGLGIDAVTVVAMSAGAAMVGSAFGPTNPFQAGIAMKLAELPAGSGLGARAVLLVAAFTLWVAWTMRHAARTRVEPDPVPAPESPASPGQSRGAHARVGSLVATAAAVAPRDLLILALVLAPMAAYVVGALAWGWGFNELSAAFLVAAFVAGPVGGLSLGKTIGVYLEGMQAMLPAAILIGVARSITVVLADGRVIDTILDRLASPLADAPPLVAALLMIPFHALVHVPVPSVSGHAVLTMPVLVPLSDLLGISRQVTVLAYQTGAGLAELLTPTNGALMAILLAAGVPYGSWAKFALGGALLAAAVGIVGIAVT
jgi:uncharacterized ion transporter superfamily protein YfcC